MRLRTTVTCAAHNCQAIIECGGGLQPGALRRPFFPGLLSFTSSPCILGGGLGAGTGLHLQQQTRYTAAGLRAARAQPGDSRVVRRSHACSGPQATSKGRRLHGAAAPRPAAARAHPTQLAAAAERPPAMRESSSSEGEEAPQPSAISGQPDAEAAPAAAGKRPQQREPLALPNPHLWAMTDMSCGV